MSILSDPSGCLRSVHGVLSLLSSSVRPNMISLAAVSDILGIIVTAEAGTFSNFSSRNRRKRARLIHWGWLVVVSASWMAFSDNVGTCNWSFGGASVMLWTLAVRATASYKERYEGMTGSSSTSGSQKESDVRLEEGLSEAGKRLKKAMRRRFKVIDGEEFFEIHKNEWVRTTEDPIGPCKTCKARGEVTRHLVWRCPFLE